jgi:cytosine/uracil/thiamine/allantoin permease
MIIILSILIGLGLNVLLAHVIANLGKEKKIGYKTAFLLSFLLSPLIGLLAVIASVKREGEPVKKIRQKLEKSDKKMIIIFLLLIFVFTVLAILNSKGLFN